MELITRWGNIYDVDSNGCCPIPYTLSSRSQFYKPETVAKKILETVAKENRIKLETERVIEINGSSN